jgi:RNA polymerase sigma-70 factor, ECF subfamily
VTTLGSAALASERVDVAALFEQHHERLMTLATLVVRDPDGAADVVQRVFEKACRHRDRLDPNLNVAGWLTRLTCNEAISLSRRKRLFQWLPLRHDHVARSETTTLDDRLLVEAALRRISPKHRAVVVLFYWHGYNLAEIAEVLNVPRGTVASRLHHARNTLASLIEVNKPENAR